MSAPNAFLASSNANRMARSSACSTMSVYVDALARRTSPRSAWSRTAQHLFSGGLHHATCTCSADSSSTRCMRMATSASASARTPSVDSASASDVKPLDRRRAALRDRHGRQRVPHLPHDVGDRRVRRHHALVDDHLATRRVGDAIDLSRSGTSTTLPAVVRSKNGRMQSTALSSSSPGTRRASGVRTIRPSSCCDVVVVLRRPERHQHLGARAVPAGRDRVLGDQDAHVGSVLAPPAARSSRPRAARTSAWCARRARAARRRIPVPASPGRSRSAPHRSGRGPACSATAGPAAA